MRNYSSIDFIEDVKDWFFGVYLPSIENPLLLSKSVNIIRNFSSSFDILGSYGSRITFRYYDVKSNSIDQPYPYHPFVYYFRSFNVLNELETFDGEFTETMKGYINGSDWKYNVPGSDATSYGSGGYSIFFEKGNSSIYNNNLKNWILVNNTFNALLGIITFDTVFYSEYYDSLAFCKFDFISLPSGFVKKQITIHVYKIIFLYSLKKKLLDI